MNNILRIKDKDGTLRSWIISNKIEKDGFNLLEVELEKDRRVVTHVRESDTYVGNNGRLYHNRGTNLSVNDDKYGRATFVSLRLS